MGPGLMKIKLLTHSSSSSSSDTALGQKMTIMAGFGVAHKLYIYNKKKK